MTLKKRYKRDLKHNLSLYVSSTFLTILSLLLFYLYYICGTGIQDFAREFSEAQKLEDASFSTYMEIPEEEIEEYEKAYDLTLEKQKYKNVETDGVTARAFSRTHKVDLYQVTAGRDVSKNDEIIISEGYAANHGIQIGDTISIGRKEYEITGFMERPDYLYMLENLTDAANNIETFLICYMTDQEFEALHPESCQYLVRYNKKDADLQKDFRMEVNDTYKLSSYLPAENNLRITMVTDQPELFLVIAYCILFTMPLLTVILISIILSRKIRSEQKMIGTLAAYGYSSRQLIFHYAGFAAVPGILGGILTTIAVAILAEPYGKLGLMDYEPMPVKFKLGIFPMFLGIMIPTVMYTLSTAMTVRKLLKNDITLLLAGAARGKNKIKKFFLGKKVSFRVKFGVRAILGNPGRSFVLFLGVLAGSFIIAFSFCNKDSMENIIPATKESMKSYEYQYTLNKLMKEEPEDQDSSRGTLLAGAVEDEGGSSLSLIGADGNPLTGLETRQGKELEVGDGYYITSLYAVISGKDKGDSMTLVNPLSMETYDIRIDEVVENDFLKGIYTSRENVAKVTGLDASCYNMILSKEKLDLPEEDLASSIIRSELDDRYQVMFTQLDLIVDLLAVLGMLICIIAIYLVVNMIISENRPNISMLRVLGYNDKKIHRLLLNDNLILVLLGAVCGIPTAFYTVRFMYMSFIDILGYKIDVVLRPVNSLLTILLVLVSYQISLYFLKRKVSKVDMVESLKDNRE